MRKSTGPVCLVVVFCLILQPAVLAASNNSRYRVYTNDGRMHDLFYCELVGGDVTGKDKLGEPVTIRSGDIRSLYRFDGTKSGQYALVGGIVGFGVALLAGMSAQSETSKHSNERIDSGKVLPVFAGCTLGGVLIGSIIGSFSEKWNRAPVDTDFGLSPDGKEVRFCLNVAF